MASQWKSVKIVSLGWSIFVAENLILSENRGAIIERLGDKGYHLLYNSLSLGSTCMILYGFLRHGRKTGPLHNLWNPAALPVKLAAFSFRSLGLVGISQQLPKLQNPWIQPPPSPTTALSLLKNPDTHNTNTTKNGNLSDTLATTPPQKHLKQPSSRCPIDFEFGKEKRPGEIWGMKRITRYPQLFSLGLTCFSFALSSSHYSHLVFWSMPLFFAFIGGAHMDSRYKRGMGGDAGLWSKEMELQSSLLPFQALIQQRQSWRDLGREIKEINAVLAVGLAALTVFL